MVIPDYYLVSFLVKPIETNENYVQNTHDDLRFIMCIDTMFYHVYRYYIESILQ